MIWKLILIFAIYVFSECPNELTQAKLIGLREKYGSCIIDSEIALQDCIIPNGSYNGKEWMTLFCDSLGGFVVFSDTYVFVNKNIYDGSSLLKGESMCFDSLGTHRITVIVNNK